SNEGHIRVQEPCADELSGLSMRHLVGPFYDLEPTHLGPQVESTRFALAGRRNDFCHSICFSDWASECSDDGSALMVEHGLCVRNRHSQLHFARVEITSAVSERVEGGRVAEEVAHPVALESTEEVR